MPACVAQPVSRKVLRSNKKAQEAVAKEWKRLWQKGAFEAYSAFDVREWSDVAREARVTGKEVHMGIVFGIMVQKHAELPDSDERKQFKYRVVFQGN